MLCNGSRGVGAPGSISGKPGLIDWIGGVFWVVSVELGCGGGLTLLIDAAFGVDAVELASEEAVE